MHSDVHTFQTHREVSRKGRDSTTPQGGNTTIADVRLTSSVQICHNITDSPSRNRNQDIINPIVPFSPQWIRNAKKLKTSIDRFFAEDRCLKPIFSKVVGCKFAPVPSLDINSSCGMNLGSNAVFTLNPNIINLGIASFNTKDKLGSVSAATTRVGRPTSSFEGIWHVHDIEEATADRVIKTRANINYILKSDLKL